MNRIAWHQKALRQLRKLATADNQEVRRAVGNLTDMPECRNVKSLMNHEHGYRLRVGRYRVLFDWDSSVQVVEIQEVMRRDERTY